VKTRANKPINLPGPVSGSQAFALGAEAGSFVARHLRAVLSFDRLGRLSAESLDGERKHPYSAAAYRSLAARQGVSGHADGARAHTRVSA